MSAKTETLLSIEVVTDHDCGNYTIGEIDFRIHIGRLRQYLKARGHEGKKNILASLGHLAYEVTETFNDTHAVDCGVEANPNL